MWEAINSFLTKVDDFVWGPPLMILIIAGGILLTIRMGVLQVRKLPLALKWMVKNEEEGEGEVTSFGALCTALSATIGTGNIVGVATAMVSGGPGALVWMWISALFGITSKFSECMLAIKYREVNAKGEISGGPMYTMKKALKHKRFGSVLGWLFAFFAVVASFGIGNMTQGNSISTAVHETFGVSVSTVGAVITILALLIIIGGIGFFTWEDIYLHKFHFKHYHMQSKVILTTTLCLILLPAVFFFFQDYGNLSGIHRLLASLFQAVTPRTAGFNTTDLSMLTGASKAMMILLMLIGGSPSSTAGGMKTTTFALLLLNVLATVQSCDDVTAFGRRIDASVIKNATTIAMMYFILFFAGGMTISVYEGLPLSSCLFEAASAVGTVGLTLGITPKLHILSQIILIILMYLGRVGGLTLIYAVFSGRNKGNAKLPLEKITVG